MKLARILCVVAAMALFVVAAPVQADSSDQSFRATLTEDFAFLGCPAPVGPSAFTCGTAKVHDFGKATVETVLTGFAYIGSGCFADSHTSTLTFKRGTLIINITGTLCGTGGGNFVLDGTYSIAGGTGRFAGATGTGTVHAVRQNGPVIAKLVGSIVLPEEVD